MGFATPIWLLLLIPWTGALVWALVGRVEFARVPAIFLWDRSNVELSRERLFRVPPDWVLWLLGAALLGILCASGLGIWWPWGSGRAIVVVDCGLSMSASGRVADAVGAAKFGVVRVVCMPGDAIENDDGVPVDRLTFTAAPTRDLLQRAVRSALSENAGRIFVVTDQGVDVVDDRLVILRPTKALENVGIETLAVSEQPNGAQAMVRVFNDSSKTSAVLNVDRVVTSIDLPARGSKRDYFVDLPAIGSAVSARIGVEDDLLADNAAWVVQKRGWPKVEARSGVSAAVSRMIEVYTRQRPPSSTGRTVAVVEGFFTLPENAPAIALAPFGGGQPLDPTKPVRMEFDHPLARNVDWPKLITDARGHAGPGEGWMTVVAQGDRVLVATRQLQDGARQVWVGIDAPDFALRPDFVVFFANVFDWVGETSGGYASEQAGSLGREYRAVVVSDPKIDAAPGVYKRPDGELVATSVDVAKDRIVSPPNAKPLAASSGGVVGMSGGLLLGAVGCCVMGVLRLTRI